MEDSDESLPSVPSGGSVESDEGSWDEDIEDEEEDDDGSRSVDMNETEVNGPSRLISNGRVQTKSQDYYLDKTKIGIRSETDDQLQIFKTQPIAGPSSVAYRELNNKRERKEIQLRNHPKRIKLDEEPNVPPEQKLLVLRRDMLMLSSEHCDVIRETIVEAICKAEEPGSNYQFYNAMLTKTGSAYIISCANKQSADWLIKVKMPEVEGQETYICRLSDLPKRVKVGAFFPSSNYTNEKLVALLKQQNSGLGLHFDEWKIKDFKRGAEDSKSRDNGTYVIILISEEDFKILTPFGCRLFFELSTVQLNVISKAVLPLGKS